MVRLAHCDVVVADRGREQVEHPRVNPGEVDGDDGEQTDAAMHAAPPQDRRCGPESGSASRTNALRSQRQCQVSGRDHDGVADGHRDARAPVRAASLLQSGCLLCRTPCACCAHRTTPLRRAGAQARFHRGFRLDPTRVASPCTQPYETPTAPNPGPRKRRLRCRSAAFDLSAQAVADVGENVVGLMSDHTDNDDDEDRDQDDESTRTRRVPDHARYRAAGWWERSTTSPGLPTLGKMPGSCACSIGHTLTATRCGWVTRLFRCSPKKWRPLLRRYPEISGRVPHP